MQGLDFSLILKTSAVKGGESSTPRFSVPFPCKQLQAQSEYPTGWSRSQSGHCNKYQIPVSAGNGIPVTLLTEQFLQKGKKLNNIFLTKQRCLWNRLTSVNLHYSCNNTAYGCILWYDARKPEQRSQSRRSLLGNDSANRFPRQQIRKQQLKYCWTITMQTMFSVGSDPRWRRGRIPPPWPCES
jgi:hypothetical protein